MGFRDAAVARFAPRSIAAVVAIDVKRIVCLGDGQIRWDFLEVELGDTGGFYSAKLKELDR